jgi:preprotein translocase subunit SecG
MIHQAIFIVQIVLAVLLVIVIIVQQKGTGLGSSFGGGELGFYRTKRGAEKLLFQLTITLSVLFIASSIIGLMV